jgi:hypothetical protein
MAAKQSAAAAHGGGNECVSRASRRGGGEMRSNGAGGAAYCIGGAGAKALAIAAPAATPGDIVKQRSRNIAQRTHRSAPCGGGASRRLTAASGDGDIKRNRRRDAQVGIKAQHRAWRHENGKQAALGAAHRAARGKVKMAKKRNNQQSIRK